MLQRIHRFLPDYSSHTRYRTGKARRSSEHIRHHLVVDLVEDEAE
jgi:hypothetical protein